MSTYCYETPEPRLDGKVVVPTFHWALTVPVYQNGRDQATQGRQNTTTQTEIIAKLRPRNMRDEDWINRCVPDRAVKHERAGLSHRVGRKAP
jgi:hypothetical protein